MQSTRTHDLERLDLTRRSWLGHAGAGALALSVPLLGRAADADSTFDEPSTLKAVTDFFGQTTEGLAQVVAKVFQEQGRPNGYLRGEEVAAEVIDGPKKS